jgi:hypothetical protein
MSFFHNNGKLDICSSFSGIGCDVRLLNPARLGGMLPVNEFVDKSKLNKELRFPNDVGIVPSK